MSDPYNYRKLFIHNIDYDASHEEIRRLFKKFGSLVACDVPKERNGRLRG